MPALSRRTLGDVTRRRSKTPLSRRFTYRYVLALFALAVIAVAWKVTIDASSQKISELTAHTLRAKEQPVNFSTIVRLATRVASSSTPDSSDVSNLRSTADRFEQYQLGLISGDSAAGLPQRPLDRRLDDIYNEPKNLATAVKETRANALALAQLSSAEADAKAEQLQAILSREKTINDDLELAQKVYDDLIEAEIKNQETNNAVFLSLFILATLGIGIFVFRPMARNIHLETSQLESAEKVHRENNERQTFRNELSQALEVTDSEGEVLAAVGRAFMTVVPENKVELMLTDASNSHLRVAQISPTQGAAGCPVESPQGCAAIRRGQTVVYESSRMLNVCPKLPEHAEGLCSAVCTPIMFMGSALGVLHATGPDGQPPSHTEIERLTVLASETGNRLGLLRHSHATELQATTDGLTGLLNRRTLESKARALLLDDQPFSVAMADLDHFKNLNDQHGHETGDRALRTFASVLKASLRPEDICARYGGEEFIVLLPNTAIGEANRALERLQSALATEVAKAGGVRFTASWGLTDNSSGTTFDEIVAVADAALYSAKRSGRNCIMVDGAAAAAAGMTPPEAPAATSPATKLSAPAVKPAVAPKRAPKPTPPAAPVPADEPPLVPLDAE